MGNTFRIIAFTWLVVMTSLVGAYSQTDNISSTDSIYTWDYVESIIFTEPHQALKLIDEMEARKLLPDYSLDLLRSATYYSGLDMYRLALTYGLKAYHNNLIRQSPEDLLMTYEIIAEAYKSSGEYTESTRYAIEGVEYAKQIDDKRSEANLLMIVGTNKRELGLKDEADKCVAQVIEIQEQLVKDNTDRAYVDDLSYTCAIKTLYAFEDKKYQEAIDLLPYNEELLERLKACPGIPDGLYDMRLANLSAVYACIFQAIGQPDKAAEYYRKCMETDYGKTDENKLYCFDYLMAAGRYQEVLQSIRDYRYYREEDRDTINYFYLEYNLAYEAKIQNILGNYKAAADAYRRMYVISDSLRIRDRKNGAIELATIYETKEKEEQLAHQTARLHENQMILSFAACLIGLLGFLLWRIISHSRIVKSKNQAMVGTINDLLGFRDELFRRKEENLALKEQLKAAEKELHKQNGMVAVSLPIAKTVISPIPADIPSFELLDAENSVDSDISEKVQELTSDSVCSDRALFDRVEYEIIGRKLYLQPDFSRDELLKIVRIPKNKFSSLFKQYAGTGFSGYINKLRLEYAAKLLKEHPDYTIDSIAISCGISSTTTFYRLFVGRFGMTPTEYRASDKRLEMNDV